MAARNAEALNRLANYIARHPERYNQGRWGWTAIPDAADRERVNVKECGSTQCIAGHAARQAGWTPLVVIDGDSLDIDWESVRLPGQRVFRHVSAVARKELGLTPRESAILFAGGWKPSEGRTVQWALRQLAKGASIEDVTHPVSLSVTTLAWEEDVIALSETSRYDDTLEVRV